MEFVIHDKVYSTVTHQGRGVFTLQLSNLSHTLFISTAYVPDCDGRQSHSHSLTVSKRQIDLNNNNNNNNNNPLLSMCQI